MWRNKGNLIKAKHKICAASNKYLQVTRFQNFFFNDNTRNHNLFV